MSSNLRVFIKSAYPVSFQISQCVINVIHFNTYMMHPTILVFVQEILNRRSGVDWMHLIFFKKRKLWWSRFSLTQFYLRVTEFYKHCVHSVFREFLITICKNLSYHLHTYLFLGNFSTHDVLVKLSLSIDVWGSNGDMVQFSKVP